MSGRFFLDTNIFVYSFDTGDSRKCKKSRVSRFRKFGQRDKWKGCSPTAIKMAEMRSNDDATFTPEPHIGL
jgi:hypothetical protein